MSQAHRTRPSLTRSSAGSSSAIQQTPSRPRREASRRRIGGPVEELRRFLGHVADDDLYAAWLVFATTGARAGEVAGLTWSDLDLEEGWMRVDWTLGSLGHELTWKVRPKSRAGERVMALDPATVSELKRYRQQQLTARLALGPGWRSSFKDWQGLQREDLVWPHADGRPVHPKTFYKRFLRLAAEAGLPRIRLHDLRHTYASAALASADGWHEVKVISQRLGHAAVAITWTPTPTSCPPRKWRWRTRWPA